MWEFLLSLQDFHHFHNSPIGDRITLHLGCHFLVASTPTGLPRTGARRASGSRPQHAGSLGMPWGGLYKSCTGSLPGTRTPGAKYARLVRWIPLDRRLCRSGQPLPLSRQDARRCVPFPLSGLAPRNGGNNLRRLCNPSVAECHWPGSEMPVGQRDARRGGVEMRGFLPPSRFRAEKLEAGR